MSNSHTRRASKDELAFLRQASLMLELPTSTWATGTVLFHRYCKYVTRSRSAEPLDPHVCLILCIYLATKVTEEPRKQRDMINVGHKLTNPDTDEPLAGTTFDKLRETLTKSELVLMRALGFDVNVELPHAWIANIVYGMAWWDNNAEPPRDTDMIDARIKQVAGFAWRVANQAVEAGLVDCEPARILAAACIVLAMEAYSEPLPARDLDQWADIWARTTDKRITSVCKLINSNVNITEIERE